jgi:hypothetical protein
MLRITGHELPYPAFFYQPARPACQQIRLSSRSPPLTVDIASVEERIYAQGKYYPTCGIV